MERLDYLASGLLGSVSAALAVRWALAGEFWKALLCVYAVAGAAGLLVALLLLGHWFVGVKAALTYVRTDSVAKVRPREVGEAPRPCARGVGAGGDAPGLSLDAPWPRGRKGNCRTSTWVPRTDRRPRAPRRLRLQADAVRVDPEAFNGTTELVPLEKRVVSRAGLSALLLSFHFRKLRVVLDVESNTFVPLPFADHHALDR